MNKQIHPFPLYAGFNVFCVLVNREKIETQERKRLNICIDNVYTVTNMKTIETTLKEIEVREVLRKQVKKSGNGGAIWVPKRWLGEDVVILLPKKRR